MTTKYAKLERFHDRARAKFDKDVSMIRMLKLMRATRVFITNGFLDRRMKYKVDHSHENVVDLDVSTSQMSSISDISSEKEELERLLVDSDGVLDDL